MVLSIIQYILKIQVSFSMCKLTTGMNRLHQNTHSIKHEPHVITRLIKVLNIFSPHPPPPHDNHMLLCNQMHPENAQKSPAAQTLFRMHEGLVSGAETNWEQTRSEHVTN